jgi:hypothetical protein
MLPSHVFRLLCLLAFASFAVFPGAAQERTSAPVLPVVRRVDLRDDSITLTKALAEVRRQTGITVVDDRGGAEQTFALDLRQTAFWQAVDTIAQAVNARATLSERDAAVHLVARRRGERVPPTSYDGDFRVCALQTLASRNLDSDRAGCMVSLQVVWSPTLRPLFVESQVQGLRVVDPDGRSVAVPEEGSSLAAVDGRSSLTIDLALPAFPRAARQIRELSGKLVAIAPSKMLTFRFDASLKALHDAVADGTLRRLTLEDVVSRLSSIKLDRGRWSLAVALEYPEGNLRLESFQSASLVVNNELTLISKDGKRSLSPTGYVIDHVTSRRALVTYHFTDRPGSARGRAEDWQVQYRAPARIVSVPFRFSFRDLPLP